MSALFDDTPRFDDTTRLTIESERPDYSKDWINDPKFKPQKTKIGHDDKNLLIDCLDKIPEFSKLIGPAEFTPERTDNKEAKTLGEELFPKLPKEDLIEFDRTALSIICYFDVLDGNYDKLTARQSGPNKLSKETFNELREFLTTNFDTPSEQLLYYLIINDIGKSDLAMKNLESRDLEPTDHDEALSLMAENGMLPTLQELTVKRNGKDKEVIERTLKDGINLAQFIQGECVPRSCDSLKNLGVEEINLMTAECLFDIGGATGHMNNKNGSVTLTESTVRNVLDARQAILNNLDKPERMMSDYLNLKSDRLLSGVEHNELSNAAMKISMMMRMFDKDQCATVYNYLKNTYSGDLIHELSVTGYGSERAILPYYSPALFNNTLSYLKKNSAGNLLPDPLLETLTICIPYLDYKLSETRRNITENSGIETLSLRESALIASQNPYKLFEEFMR